jgi:hypothetical protein
MEITNLLHFGTRPELRQWLKENHSKEKCCWVVTYRGKCPPEWPAIPYIDVVEEAFNLVATAMTGSLSPK